MSSIARHSRNTADLWFELVMRDLKIRYKRSLLGILWSLITPLTQLLVFVFLFHYVLKVNSGENAEASVMTGILAWSWFQSSVLQATGAVVENRELIRRPQFPINILPMVSVTTSFIHYLMALPILIGLALISGVGFKLALLMLPVLLVVQFIFSLGPAYLLATLQVKFRDVLHLASIALLLGFYITPIFYEARAVPEQYRVIYDLNPMTILIEAQRSTVLRGSLPPLESLLIVTLASAAFAYLARLFFVRSSHEFAEEL